MNRPRFNTVQEYNIVKVMQEFLRTENADQETWRLTGTPQPPILHLP